MSARSGLICLAGLVAAWGQVTTGEISGFVLDPSHSPIAGAVVTAIQNDRALARKVVTDRTGFYRLPQLPPSTYRVSAAAPNLQPATIETLNVGVNSRVRADFVLALPGRRESVQITAAVRSIQTESGELGAVINESEIHNLPLNRRDFLQLSLLAPGVLPPTQDSELSKRGSVSMHASGAREEYNNFLIDGVDNSDPYTDRYVLEPSVDSIQEFKIATNSYSAEYGRSAGGQVNVITRGGGNEWHGDAYEYLRNRALDARNFFDGSQKPQYIRNQFGASAGGPLINDRSFVFANVESLRERRGLSRLATVPTLAERSGDLGSAGRIPASRISPLALRILDLFPLPNRPGKSGNYLAQPLLKETQSQFQGRFDQRLGAAGQLTARYSYGTQDLLEPYTQESLDVPGFGDLVTNTGHNAVLHYLHVLSPRIINSLRLGFDRSFRQALQQNYQVDVGRQWGVGWLNLRPRDFGFPGINVAGYSRVGDVNQLPIDRHTNVYQLVEGLTFIAGNHDLRAGGEIRRVQLNGILDYFARGSLNFTGAISGSGIGDLLLGFPTFGIQSQFDNPQTLRTTALNAYFEDGWKVRRNLTLNLGLRYEYNTPPVDPTDRMSVYDPGSGRLLRVGTGGIPRAGIRPDRDNFAPRLGFAWTPFEKLVVRGGYGIYYDSGILVVNSSLYFNPPYFNVRVFVPSANQLLTLDDPFPARGGITPPPSPNTLSPDLTTSYLQQWNLDLQRQFGSSTTVSAAYAASKGTHLIRSRDLNQPRPAPGDVQSRRPKPAFAGIFFIESGGNSNFQSFQASVDRRFARHFSLLAGYTLSKSIDDTSAFLPTKADKNFPQDSSNYRLERAVSSFDMRHRFTAAYVYAIPARAWWLRDTDFEGITTVQSGQPFTPMLRFDNSNTGNTGGVFGSDRPNVFRNPALARPGPDAWFDVSAFAIPPRYTFGNAGRNILRGPGLATFDIALARRLALPERLKLFAAVQVFNLFNRVQFDLPEQFADEPNRFGKIFSAKAPRQIQFALRLGF